MSNLRFFYVLTLVFQFNFLQAPAAVTPANTPANEHVIEIPQLISAQQQIRELQQQNRKLWWQHKQIWKRRYFAILLNAYSLCIGISLLIIFITQCNRNHDHKCKNYETIGICIGLLLTFFPSLPGIAMIAGAHPYDSDSSDDEIEEKKKEQLESNATDLKEVLPKIKLKLQT